MPFIAPLIPLIIGGITAGLGIDQALNSSGTPNMSKAPALTPLTASQNASQTATVGQQLPNLQSLTGGSLSPEYAAQFGALQSGLANDPQASGNVQAAINQYFGLAAPGQMGLTPSSASGGSGDGFGWLGKILGLGSSATPSAPPSGSGGGGIAEMLNVGGGGQSGPGGGYSSWIQQQLQNNPFQGLTG